MLVFVFSFVMIGSYVYIVCSQFSLPLVQTFAGWLNAILIIVTFSSVGRSLNRDQPTYFNF
jgi:hypothetical protein